MKKRRNFTLGERYADLKKKFIILLFIFITFKAAVFVYIYLNYDYFVFKHLTAQNYLFTEALDELYEQELGEGLSKNYYKYFDNLVISIVTRQIRQINGDRYTYMYTPDQYKDYKTSVEEEAAQSILKELSENIVYLRITNYSRHTLKFIKEKESELKQYENIIIDLRSNPGGQINVYHKTADMFIAKNDTICYEKARLPIFNREIKSSTAPVFEFSQIVILQDRNTASSSEGFICALKDNLDNVTVIGEDSFGKGIGQTTIPLKNGYAVKATTFKWLSPDRQSIHGTGISADINYEGDNIIEYSIQNIQENSKY